MYGGLVGVILGCFALGVVLKGIWNWYLANANKPSAILLYAFVPALTIILLRGGIPDTLTRMFFTVLPALIAQRYWSRTRRISRAYKQA
jgi:Mn2+/Fe2+ NRAMP family transporter